jgi:hypothetical protein
VSGLDNVSHVGPPRAASHPNAARISAENLSLMARRLGRCGDINPITGHVCVTQPHETLGPDGEDHMAVQIGGPNDGYVYARWR